MWRGDLVGRCGGGIANPAQNSLRTGAAEVGPAHVFQFMKYSTNDFATGKNTGSLFRGRISSTEKTVSCPTFWNGTTGTVLWSWSMCMKTEGEVKVMAVDKGKEDWFQVRVRVACGEHNRVRALDIFTSQTDPFTNANAGHPSSAG